MPVEADQVEGVCDASFISDSIDSPIKRHIFLHGQVIVDRKLLRHVSGAGSHFFALPERVESQHGRFAFARLEQTEQHTDRCGLARTVWAKVTDHFALVHFEVYMIDRGEIPETACEILNVNNRQTHE